GSSSSPSKSPISTVTSCGCAAGSRWATWWRSTSETWRTARRCSRWPSVASVLPSRNNFVAAALLLIGGGLARAQEPEVVELDRAVAIAVARNPNVQVAAEEITRAHALVEQVRSASLPSLAGNAFYTRLDGGPVAGSMNNVDANLGGLNLSVSIPIVAPRSW